MAGLIFTLTDCTLSSGGEIDCRTVRWQIQIFLFCCRWMKRFLACPTSECVCVCVCVGACKTFPRLQVIPIVGHELKSSPMAVDVAEPSAIQFSDNFFYNYYYRWRSDGGTLIYCQTSRVHWFRFQIFGLMPETDGLTNRWQHRQTNSQSNAQKRLQVMRTSTQRGDNDDNNEKWINKNKFRWKPRKTEGEKENTAVASLSNWNRRSRSHNLSLNRGPTIINSWIFNTISSVAGHSACRFTWQKQKTKQKITSI